MYNAKFLEKTETQKRDKLLRILSAKLPTAEKEDLVKIIAALNLKRQYNIRICRNRRQMSSLAVAEKIENVENVDGIDWKSQTESLVKVILGDITPGTYSNMGKEETGSDAVVGQSPIYAFTKVKYNAGYLDTSTPEYENFLYLYQPS